MLGRIIGEDIELDVVVASDVGGVHIDRGHLEQVVVNLVVNARDAMPDGGQLRIEIQNASLDQEYAERHSDVRPGDYVQIAVSDTGTGMSRAVLERIFEPFFTTKEAGKGTGLGLATSYGIIREAGGHFSVYSEKGLGTTMRVYLPRVAGADETKGVAEPDFRTETPISATVLVVEDDEGVRRTAVRTLQALGCTVLEAGSGEWALEVLERSGASVDLIFTDLIMPGLGGIELVAKAKGMVPRAKVLFTTGYTADMAYRLKLLREQANVLSKPYTATELAAKVRAVISEGRPSTHGRRQ
jgi:CheY-like chemotaxis protein